MTPNGDGANDYFEIRNTGVSMVTLVQVFNRWGELVFESNSIEDKWDGNHRGQPVNPGVYMYILEGICVNENVFTLSGNVTVIR
jgi:gliding motility-associated-like protein